MTLSGLRLSQQISANVTGTGITQRVLVGGTNTVNLTTTNANIVYGFTIKSGANSNNIKWELDNHTLEEQGSGTAVTCTEEVPTSGEGSILDAVGSSITAAGTAVAIYYEIPGNTANGKQVTATANDSQFGTVRLTGDASNVKSALIIPRLACAGKYINFTFSDSALEVKVVYLAKTA